MNFDNVYRYAVNELLKLDPVLTYHNVWHTLSDVLPAADNLSGLMGIEKSQQLLLRTAVLFHDMGFLAQYQENEYIGANMAEAALPEFGYTEGQIQVIKNLIMATKLPQSPKNLLEEIICDADLDSLGRWDFFIRSEDLYKELNSHGKVIEENVWSLTQLDFLMGHEYFTDTANRLRNIGKEKNIKTLQTHIEKMEYMPDKWR